MTLDTCICGSGAMPHGYYGKIKGTPAFICEHCGVDKMREGFNNIDGQHWAERWADERAEQDKASDPEGFVTVWPLICSCGSGLHEEPRFGKSGRVLFHACLDCWATRLTLFVLGDIRAH